MTTAPVHSLTPAAISRAAKSAIAKPATGLMTWVMTWVIMVQRMIVRISLAGWFVRLYRNHRSRRELAALSPHLLADIGVSEEQRQAELRKPFWKNQGPER